MKNDAVSNDFAAEIRTLAGALDRRDEVVRDLERLVDLAENWMSAEGLATAPPRVTPGRAVLAAWLSPLASGTVLHFGRGDGAIAGALGVSGARVVSSVDHPARAIASAVRYGSPTVEFQTSETESSESALPVELVVVEVDADGPLVPFDRVVPHLAPRGVLAILGGDGPGERDDLVEVGAFRVDEGSVVVPVRMSDEQAEMRLYRLLGPVVEASPVVAEAGPATVPPAPLERILARRPVHAPWETGLQQQARRVRRLPVPPQELIDWVGGGTPQTFVQVGMLSAQQLLVYCRLKPTDRVLEPGCGCGRNARAIASYLDERYGRYDGFDIHEKAIGWATDKITAVYPNVRFSFADIQNTNYNPRGRVPAAEFVFPYDDEAFDVVFLPSVFTHMVRGEFEQYAREIHRVLKPGGVLLGWHFLLDAVSRERVQAGSASLALQPFDEVAWAQDPLNPCAAIAFDESYVLEQYEATGLRVQAVLHGNWSGRESDGIGEYQDRVLATRRA